MQAHPSVPGISDFSLMAAVKTGSQEAFATLCRRYQQPLMNYFRRMGADIHSAEDLVQETFLRLYHYRSRYLPSARFPVFLYRLARNAGIDAWRREQRVPSPAPWPVEGVPGKCRQGQVEWRMDIQDALGRLAEHHRQVVVMNLYLGLSYQEIAEALEIPLGTVKSRMHTALGRLQEALAKITGAVGERA